MDHLEAYLPHRDTSDTVPGKEKPGPETSVPRLRCLRGFSDYVESFSVRTSHVKERTYNGSESRSNTTLLNSV